MKINVESYELSLWSNQDEFLISLRVPDGEFEGQAYDVKLTKNINGLKTLEFSVPMYCFDSSIGEIAENSRWKSIINEQKIRLKINPGLINEEIYEFVLKTFTESRTGLEKIAHCVCQDYAIFELSKIGWGINFSEATITNNEIDDFSTDPESKIMTIDYWLEKLFYSKTKLGRVKLSPTENATDLLYLGRALTPRDEDGNSIDSSIDPETGLPYDPIQLTTGMKNTYQNEAGWTWVVNTADNKLYEDIEPADYAPVSVAPFEWGARSYQHNDILFQPTQLRWHPMTEEDIAAGWEYTLEEKKRIIKNERTNIYNILQTLAEKFEFWMTFQYTYNSLGQIIARTIIIENEVIEENNVFEIRFGVNLNNITRVVNSDTITTKLFVPPINSTSIEGKAISISESGANFMREMYLLNFDYYYQIGLLTAEDRVNIGNFQTEVRNLNLDIENKQKDILPLTFRLDSLNADLEVENASLNAYDEEIMDLQAKINVINLDDLVIESWDEENTKAYGYVGEYKTIPDTSIINMNKNGVLGAIPLTFSVNGVEQTITYPPKYYNKASWELETILDDVLDFTEIPSTDLIYSQEPGMEGVITGFYTDNIIPPGGASYVRLRYKYIPYYWYYQLQLNLIAKRQAVSNKIIALEEEIDVINNETTGLLIILQQELDELLREKTAVVQLFERDYSYFIKEGQWEDNDYNTYTKSIDGRGIEGEVNYWTIVPTEVSLYNKLFDLDNSVVTYYYMTIPLQADLTTLVFSLPDIDDTGMTFVQDVNFFYGIDSTAGESIPCFIFTTAIAGITNGTNINATYENLQTGATDVLEEVFTTVTSETLVTVQTKTADIIDPDFIYDTLQIFYVENNFELTAYEDFEYKLDTVYIEGGLLPDTFYNVIRVTFKTTNNCYNYLPIYQDNFYFKYKQDITNKFFFRDAELTMKVASIPDVSYTMDIINIAGLPGCENFKPQLAMMVPIFDKEMLFNGLEGFITEISFVLDKPEESTIAVTSYKNKFADLFQRIVETTNTIQYNEESLMRAANAFDNDGSLTQATWYQSFLMNKVDFPYGTTNEVTIDVNGITLIDTSKLINGVSPLIRMIGQGIYLSIEEDLITGERIWRTGITATGINASVVNTGNLNVKNLMIWNEDQFRFLWDADGIKAYGELYDGETDYNKYVKLNDRGLKFVYNRDDAFGNPQEIATVSLNWDGLLISGQSGAIQLNGDYGLIVEDAVLQRRVQIGKLDGEEDLYGLRLINSDDGIVMQTGTDGELWLSRFLHVGGYASGGVVVDSTVGMYGGEDPAFMYLDSNLEERGYIRFWAGEDVVNHLLNFVVTSEGFLHGRNVDVEGRIVATSGTIGNWEIKTDYLYGQTTGLASEEGSDNVAFWAGATHGNRDYAPFRILNDGTLHASSADITGIIEATQLILGGEDILESVDNMLMGPFLTSLKSLFMTGILTDKIIDPSMQSNTLSIASFPSDAARIGLIITGSDGTNHWDLITKSTDSVTDDTDPENPITIISGSSVTMAFNGKDVLKGFSGLGEAAQFIYATGQWSFQNAIVQSNSYFESANIDWVEGGGGIEFTFKNIYNEKPIYLIHPTADTEVIKVGELYTGIRIFPLGGAAGQVYNFIAFCKGKI